jgi:hypothetical protein
MNRICCICDGVIGQCRHSFIDRWVRSAQERKKQREESEAKFKAIGEEVINVVRGVVSLAIIIFMIMIWRACTAIPDTPVTIDSSKCDPYRDTARQYYCHFSDFNFGGLSTPAHSAAIMMAGALRIDRALAEMCATEAEQDFSLYTCSHYDSVAFCNRTQICRSGDPPWPGAEPYFNPPQM